jgi:cytidylate kinase
MLNFKKFINEGVYDPGIFKIFFIAGGPGSGKSFVVNHIGFKALGLKIVNSDDILEYLLKSNNKNLDISNYSDKEKEEFNRIRNNAKRLTDNKMKNYISGRLGMIIDGTGANFDKIKKSSEIFKNLGYDS